MAAMTAERVLESITTGSMAIYVEGWNEENLLALAELAAAKPFGGRRRPHRRGDEQPLHQPVDPARPVQPAAMERLDPRSW